MLSTVTLALTCSISAGIMNGSFALPTKHIKTWTFENIWLNYSIWAFLILPWLTLFIFNPSIISIYQNISSNTLMTLLIGGFLFGAGQVCFALALRTIGLGLGFVINIGLGTGLGSLLPLLTLDSHSIFTPAGITTMIGLAFIVVGLLLSYSSGKQRDQALKTTQTKTFYQLGAFLAILAGVFSAGQNYVFAATSSMHDMALAAGADPLIASIIIWPPFLTCSFIPYAIYMLYLHSNNNSFKHYRQGFFQNNILGIVMAFFWFGSLAIYSKASLLIGSLGPVIAWPLFMVLIILTSNFWSWRHKEWEGCSVEIKRRALLSISALVVAVFILTFSAYLAH
jgi:L-rhamnose-H+ transport protein